MRARTLWPIALAAIAPGAAAASAWPGCELDGIAATVRGDTLTVAHGHATYNCCMDGVEYSVLQEPGRIEIRETEILTDPCTCLCCFDLEVEVRDLAPGEYDLVFLWFDYDEGGWREWTDHVTVTGGGSGPWVARTWDSGCIIPPSAAGEPVPASSWGRSKAAYR